jgi:hypothetical protein
LPVQSVTALINENNQISRMTHTLMQRLGTPADTPQRGHS